MADGYDIHLDPARTERLQSLADAAGIPLADFALMLLDGKFTSEDLEDFEALAEYERTGEYIELEEALTRFEANVDAKLRARGK